RAAPPSIGLRAGGAAHVVHHRPRARRRSFPDRRPADAADRADGRDRDAGDRSCGRHPRWSRLFVHAALGRGRLRGVLARRRALLRRPLDRPGILSGGAVTEMPVDLVWNKGIARLCDRRIPDEFPDGLAYRPVPTLAGARMSPDLPADVIADPARDADIRQGEIVWVRLSWLPAFVRRVLPLVRSPFVLATGDSDSSVPSGPPPELVRPILASPYVLRWFTQNHDGAAPERIAPLPIGIDFHSLAEHAVWGESMASPSEQESRLLAIGRALPPLRQRAPQLYIDFAWDAKKRSDAAPAAARLAESRHAVVKMLRRRGTVRCQEAPLPRGEMWRGRGQYAAVLSPHGGGLDCHRTWEALALGHLVVVPSSPLNPLFEGLPVVTVSDWDQVSAGNLARWLSRPAGSATAERERLTSRYWVAAMRSMTMRA